MKRLEYTKYIEKLSLIDLDQSTLSELFALKLEYLFLCSGLSLIKFSIAVNLNYSYLNDLLRGTKHISLNKLDVMCKIKKIDDSSIHFFTHYIKFI